MKQYFNKEAFIEGLCCLLFAAAILYLIFTEKYLMFVRPGMKIYLYFAAAVMLVWAISCFRRVPTPQYKLRLNRFLVIVVPVIAMFLPYTAIKASEISITGQMQTGQSDTSGSISQNDTDSSQSTQQSNANAQNISENTPDTSSQNVTVNSNNSSQQATASDTQNSNQQNNAQQNNAQQNSQGQSSGSQGQQMRIPSGLDKENKTITIPDDEFYAWIVQLNYYPDEYEGYTIHIHGTVYREDSMKENEFAVTRLLMSCCVADLVNCGPLCFYDNASELTEDAWVNVTGTYHYDKLKGMEITVTGIEDAEAAEEEYIYPVF